MEIDLNCMTDFKMHTNMSLNVLLLAAGMGTRLRPLTNTMPKCMVPIMGRPLLDYWIELLFSKEIKAPVGPIGTVFINTHYLPESVDQYVKTCAHSDRLSTIHEEALLGTAGTFVKLISRLKGQDLLLAHADNLTLFDVNAFVHKHHNRPTGCIASMMTFETDDPQSCGIVELDAQDVAVAFHEKLENPPGNLANAAVFLFSPEAIETIELMSKNKNLFDVSLDIVPSLLGKMATFQNKIYHRDIGNTHSLAQAEKEFPSVYQAFKQQTPLLH